MASGWAGPPGKSVVGVILGKKGLLRDESVARKSCKKTGSMMTQTQPPVVYSDMIMIHVQVLD